MVAVEPPFLRERRWRLSPVIDNIQVSIGSGVCHTLLVVGIACD